MHNKNNNKKSIYLRRLFPEPENKRKIKNLKIDSESVHYISIYRQAAQISKILKRILLKFRLDPKNTFITDATAGVGGNVISFAKHFKWVHAIEIDKLRVDYLINNMNVYNLKNFQPINGDCIKELVKIKRQEVVFLDPPWGGRNYKKFKTLRLSVSNMSIESLCEMIFDKNQMRCVPKIVMLKLPLNYDVKHFSMKMKGKYIETIDIGKMFVVTVVNLDGQDNSKKC